MAPVPPVTRMGTAKSSAFKCCCMIMFSFSGSGLATECVGIVVFTALTRAADGM